MSLSEHCFRSCGESSSLLLCWEFNLDRPALPCHCLGSFISEWEFLTLHFINWLLIMMLIVTFRKYL